MKTSFLKLVLLFTFGLFNLNASAQSDKDALISLVKEVSAAFVARDAPRFAACYTEDVDFINPLGGVIKGRTAVEQAHTALYKAWANKPKSKGEIENLTVRFLSPDVAICQWSSKEKGMVNGNPVTEEASFMNVSQRVAGKWLIAAFSITPVRSMPGMQQAKN